MGEYLPAKLGMDQGEKPIFMRIHTGWKAGENYVYIFENGKGVRIPSTAYETKAPRRKLVNVCSSASPISAVFYEVEKSPFEIIMVNNVDRAIIIKTSLIPIKTTKTSGGVTLMTLKNGQKLVDCRKDFESIYEDTKGYRKLKIPASGQLLNEKDIKAQQLRIDG
jgi:DNA gyrase subunit A